MSAQEHHHEQTQTAASADLNSVTSNSKEHFSLRSQMHADLREKVTFIGATIYSTHEDNCNSAWRAVKGTSYAELIRFPGDPPPSLQE